MKKLSNSVSMSELLHMREMGLSNQQIADRLGVSYMTVKRYIGKQPEGMRAAYKRKEKPLPPVETVAVEPAPVLSFTERLAAMQRPTLDPQVVGTPADLSRQVELLGELNMPSEIENAKHDVINHPKHYTREGAMESIDEMLLIFGKEAVMHFCVCNAWKYRYRAAMKNGEEDIKKSDWYMAKYKELAEME